MAIKIFAGVLAIFMMLAFVGPMVFKLKDVALGCVILIGVVMMLTDLWQSLKSKDD